LIGTGILLTFSLQPFAAAITEATLADNDFAVFDKLGNLPEEVTRDEESRFFSVRCYLDQDKIIL
jgi:hypothetical protein